MVVDSSALLAIIFDEPSAAWIEEQLEKNREHLIMSTVNLAESLIIIQSRQPAMFQTLREVIFSTQIHFVPPTVRHAELAARARLEYPINLGDCFAYALAKEESCPILTIDPDFKKTDAVVVIP